jgi:hypothetical protein
MKALGILMIVLFTGFVSALSFSDTNSSDFSGTFNLTWYNGTALVLDYSNLSGTYTSRVFDSGSYAQWSSIDSLLARSGKDYFFVLDNNNNVFKSQNNGTTWVDVTSSGYNSDSNGFVMNSSGAFFIIASDRKVYSSLDSGVTWSVLNNTVQFADLSRGLAIDENNILYAVVQGKRIYNSVDGGVSWNLVNGTFSSGTTNTQRCLFYYNSSLYTTDDASAVYKSTNGGVSWSMINSSFAAPHCFTMTANSSGAFFIGTDNQRVYSSLDRGVTWTQITPSNAYSSDINGMVVDPSNVLYASVRQHKFYRSSDGVTWTIVNDTYTSANTGSQYGMVYQPIRTNLTFQVKSCSTVDCSDGIFVGPGNMSSAFFYDSNSSFNLTGRYFQYRLYLRTNEGSFTPYLKNVSVQYSLLDVAGPEFSLMQTSIPSFYNSSLSYFNLSWSDSSGIDSVLIESNFSGISRNYTMYLISGNTYGFNASISAGTFYWRSYANDTLGNMNVSDTAEFTIAKSSPSLELYLNGSQSNTTIFYGSASDVSGIELNNGDADIDYALYRNGLSIDSGSSTYDNEVLGAGNYIYVLNATEGANYTSSSVSFGLSVAQASPSLSLLINGVDSDTSTTLNTNVTINASVVVPSGLSAEIYENSALLDTTSSYFVNKSYSTVGLIIWNITFAGNQNYTSLAKSHTISVTDVDIPQYSNLIVSPNAPSYVSNETYQFNATWTDNIAIDNVVLDFNGVNYTYASGAITRVANEYSLSLSNLGAGNYTYTWYANDTSGNSASTSSQVYSIVKAASSLSISIIPSNESVYGAEINVSCSANHLESIPTLTLNGVSVTNPSSQVLAADTHQYSCTSAESQNYSASSSTSDVIISKATSSLLLLLNGQSSDIALSETEGLVNLSASLVSPVTGTVNLTVNNVLVAEGLNSVENVSIFDVAGTYVISAIYGGNQNYSSSSSSFNVVVSSASESANEGSSRASFDIEEPSRVSLKPGESTRTEVKVINTGTKVLENCQITNIGDWLSSNDVQDIGRGDSARLDLSVSVPSAQPPGLYSSDFTVACTNIKESSQLRIDVYTTEKPISQDKTKVTVIGAVQVSDGLFRVTYEAQELSGKTQTITVKFSLVDETGKSVEFFDTRTLIANEKKQFVVDILANQQLTGKVTLTGDNGFEQSTLVLQSQAPAADTISGLAILSGRSVSDLGAAVLLIVSALLIAYLIHRTHRLQDRVIVHKRLAGR